MINETLLRFNGFLDKKVLSNDMVSYGGGDEPNS